MIQFFRFILIALCIGNGFAWSDSSEFPTLGKDVNSPDTDFFELMKYAYLSSVAYCSLEGLLEGLIGTQDETCPSLACKHKYVKDINIVKRFNFDNFLDVGNGFMAVDPKLSTIYIGFKGTSSLSDWINNLDVFNTKYEPQVLKDSSFGIAGSCCNGCKVHRGFESFIRKSGSEILNMIIELKEEYPKHDIVLFGHSLGAALALLTAIEIRLLGYEALVVTVASPKIGNKKFARFVDLLFETKKVINHIEKEKSFESLRTGYIRMIHRHDLIPFLPPTDKYAHAGYEYYLSVQGYEQTPMTIYRRGLEYLENEAFDYLDTIKNFRRIDHSSYFIPLTTCAKLEPGFQLKSDSDSDSDSDLGSPKS